MEGIDPMEGTPTYADPMEATPTYARLRARGGPLPVSTKIYQRTGTVAGPSAVGEQ